MPDIKKALDLIEKGKFEEAKPHIDSSNINAPVDENQNSILMRVLYSEKSDGPSRAKFATYLVEQGADVTHISGKTNRNVLHASARWCSAAVPFLLNELSKKIPKDKFPLYMEARDKEDDTPLTCAIFGGSRIAVENLLLFGADPNAVCGKGKHTPMFLLLMKAHADRNNASWTNEYLNVANILANHPNINLNLELLATDLLDIFNANLYINKMINPYQYALHKGLSAFATILAKAQVIKDQLPYTLLSKITQMMDQLDSKVDQLDQKVKNLQLQTAQPSLDNNQATQSGTGGSPQFWNKSNN